MDSLTHVGYTFGTVKILIRITSLSLIFSLCLNLAPGGALAAVPLTVQRHTPFEEEALSARLLTSRRGPVLLAVVLCSVMSSHLARPAQDSLQALRMKFPTIRFDAEPGNSQTKWQSRELLRALQTVQKMLPRAIPLIAGITLERGNASYMATGQNNTWFINLGIEHMDGTNEGTYGGQYASAVAATSTEYILEHEMGHVIYHAIRDQIPELTEVYTSLYTRLQLPAGAYSAEEWIGEDIQRYLFTGRPMDYFVVNGVSMKVADIRESMPERQAVLEKVRVAMGQSARMPPSPPLPNAWYVPNENVRPIIVYRFRESSFQGIREPAQVDPIDIPWRDQLTQKVRDLNLRLPPSQRIYMVRLVETARAPEMKDHVLTLSNSMANDWVLEKSAGAIMNAIEQLQNQGLAAPSPTIPPALPAQRWVSTAA